jgi:ubiquinone biosynthesis protein UbiJ
MFSFLLTKAIAKLKQVDPEVFTPLNPHIGKIVLLNITFPLSGSKLIYLLIAKNNIEVIHRGSTLSTDLSLTGKLFDLGRFGIDYLNLNSNAQQSEVITLLHRHHIQCIGDTGLLYAWQAVLKQADLDWTAFWAPLVGNKMAFPLTQFFKKTKHAADEIIQHNLHDFKDYVLYENTCLVTNQEAETWIEDILVLKNDTERLEKNIALLNSRIEKLT